MARAEVSEIRMQAQAGLAVASGFVDDFGASRRSRFGGPRANNLASCLLRRRSEPEGHIAFPLCLVLHMQTATEPSRWGLDPTLNPKTLVPVWVPVSLRIKCSWLQLRATIYCL